MKLPLSWAADDRAIMTHMQMGQGVFRLAWSRLLVILHTSCGSCLLGLDHMDWLHCRSRRGCSDERSAISTEASALIGS